MERTFQGFAKIFLFSAASLCALSMAATANAEDKTIASRTEEVDGVRLQYLTAGRGPAVILLHGYAETSLMWKPIIPVLAERFTVGFMGCRGSLASKERVSLGMTSA